METKRRKKKSCQLLIEPTIEEENLAEQMPTRPMFTWGRSMSVNETKAMNEKMKRDKSKNVISSGSLASEYNESSMQERKKKMAPNTGGGRSRRQTELAAQMLVILFGLILINLALLPGFSGNFSLVQAQQTSATAGRVFTTTTSVRSLFNTSTSAPPPTSGTVTQRPTSEQRSPLTIEASSVRSQLTSTTEIPLVSSPTILVPGNKSELTAGSVAITASQTSSITVVEQPKSEETVDERSPKQPKTEASSATVGTAESTNEPGAVSSRVNDAPAGSGVADESEESGEDETSNGSTDTPPAGGLATGGGLTVGEAEFNSAPEGGSGNGGNKFGAFIVDTAGEAATQLIDRMRTLGTESTAESADESPEPAPSRLPSDSNESNLDERHDSGDKDERSVDPRASNTSNTNSTSNPESEPSDEEKQLNLAMDTYRRWRATADDLIELFSRKVMPILVEHGYDIDPVTVAGVLQVYNGIRTLKPWALKLLDSWAKITPGILVGTQSDFGDYDECLNVRVDDPSGLALNTGEESRDELTGLKASTVVGRYCLADIEFPKPPRVRPIPGSNEPQVLGQDGEKFYAPIELRKPLFNFSTTAAFRDTIFVETGNFFHMLYVDPIRIGLCLTNKVDPDSFARVFNKVFEEFRITMNFRGRCVTKYDRPVWSEYQTISAYVLATACSLVIISTLLDILHAKLNKLPMPKCMDEWRLRLYHSLYKCRPLFTSFSIIRNTKRLFKPQPAKLLNPTNSTGSIGEQQAAGGKQFNLNLAQAASVIHLAASPSGGSDSKRKLRTPNQLHELTGSTSATSSESSDSSPSIERRSSLTSSAINLISEPGSLIGTPSGTRAQAHNGRRQIQNATPKVTKGANNNLLCLHGIRVITMTWMIVNHTYLFGGFFVLWAHRRLIDIAEWPKSLSFQLVLNGWLTVETYFFLSATIIVLNVLPLMKSRHFAYLPYIMHRLVRLLPAYVGLVCLNFLWPLISSGPFWLVKGRSFIQTPCENYLWTNFLFINNWIWPEKQCMVHTWFLSADFQLYLLAPILVYALCRRPVLGHTLNIIVALLASLLSGFVIYAHKLLPTTLINKLEFDFIKQQLSYSYFATYQHMGPYCLGIFIGYLLHNRPHVHLPKHLTWLLWLLLPPLSFTTLLLTYLWNGAYDDPALFNPSPLVSAFYVAIHRTIWTSLLAWIVFACVTGRAKLMSSFLSHSMFIPLSRLSFSIYLVHLPVIMFRALNLRHTIEWTDTNILWEACGNFIASIIVGYFVNVTFESPIINLEAVIFRRTSENQTNASERQHEYTPTAKKSNGEFTYGANHTGRLGQKLTNDDEKAQKSRPNLIQSQLSSSLSKNSKDSDLDNSSSGDDFEVDSKSAAEGKNNEPPSPSSSRLAERQIGDPSSEDSHFGSSSNTSLNDSYFQIPTVSTSSTRWASGLEAQNVTNSSTQIPLRVKAFRPKQESTVERIFGPGNQMEPPGRYLSEGAKLAAAAAPSSPAQKQLPHHRIQAHHPDGIGKPLAHVRRYSTIEMASRNVLDVNDDFSTLYPIASEYQHYGRAGFQLPYNQHRAMNLFRPSQYATLARTSRFNHEPSDGGLLDLSVPSQQQPINYTLTKLGTRSHLGEAPISTRRAIQYNQAETADNLLLRRKAHLFQRRQGRYNTLTGTGSAREWRQQHLLSSGNRLTDDFTDNDNGPLTSWQRTKTNLHKKQAQQSASSSSAASDWVVKGNEVAEANWLQPGGMIPRIDSSTLRGHSSGRLEQAAVSIVEEEPGREEHEEAAHL